MGTLFFFVGVLPKIGISEETGKNCELVMRVDPAKTAG
jgi:hypothetical protein